MRKRFVLGLTALALASAVAVGCTTSSEEDAEASEADLVSRNDLYTGKWTNWYHERRLTGLRKLQVMRTWLQESNLFDPRVQGAPVHINGSEIRCTEASASVRQIDGTCNDLGKPWAGAANVRFGRNVTLDHASPNRAKIMEPNPREVSRVLLTRDQFKAVPFLNMMAAGWIQFMTHDWISHGPVPERNNVPSDAFFRIPLKPDDPFALRHGTSVMLVPQTMTDPTRASAEDTGGIPPAYINEVTHWWDSSQVYGSDKSTAASLRENTGGRLIVRAVSADNLGRLPLQDSGVEKTGFNRNWWLGLSFFHHLFALEHNKIAAMLEERHPDWTDQKIYDTARMINAAQQAKIHTVEWTPAILPLPVLSDAMHANWEGLNVTGWFKLLGGQQNDHGTAYSLTEEFTAVYRLHSLLPESMFIDGRSLPLPELRDAKSHAVSDSVPLHKVAWAFGTQRPGQLTLNNYPAFLQDLPVPGFAGFDMGAIDVLRDRERGVPRYNEFRRQLHLKPMDRFEDLTSDPTHLAKLKQVYGEGGIEDLDLLIGTLAEGNEHRPNKDGVVFGFGETQFQIFLLMASRRIESDRFLTRNFTDEVYTSEGMRWIKDATFKKILLRHFPELGSTGLANVENAFQPWL